MSHIINKLKVASQQQDSRPIKSAPPKTNPPSTTVADGKTKPEKKEFSGLQKGFFSSKPKVKAKTNPKSITPAKPIKDNDDIPFIKASTEKQKNPLEFSEIKEAMASQFEKTRNGSYIVHVDMDHYTNAI